jgi:UDP-N-acetylglucosamine 2-epimerase (non-hydrolysing)
MMKKNLIVFGTRPEAIKMAPLVKKFQENSDFETKVCVTAQHREMLDQVMDFFDIKPDYDLNLMKKGQNLYDLTADIIVGLKSVLEEYQPDYVYVHGDTTTSMAAGLAAFYFGAKVCHVEAGLRTYNKRSPFPEELNRQLTGRISDYHFAPTITSKANLLSENIDEKSVIITGNTVIDALFISTKKVESFENEEIKLVQKIIDPSKKIILVTGHRRENHGEGFERICIALKTIIEQNPDVQIIYPVHLNPNVSNTVYAILDGVQGVELISPLSYPAFVWLMNKSYLIITDSGGVQEEAPSIGKPVLVMRDTTERPEAVEAGTVVLVGTDVNAILSHCEKLLYDKEHYNFMCSLSNPYGDGMASERIVDFMKSI